MAPALGPVLVLALVAIAACGCTQGSDDPAGPAVDTTMRVRVNGSATLSGASFDLGHDLAFTVLAVADPTVGGPNCQENVEPVRVRSACVFGTAVTASSVEWLVTVRAATGVVPSQHVTSITCAAADTSGNAVAVTCSVL
jgi:hypothetical protein